MSDTFWTQLFGTLAIIALGYLKHLSDKRDAKILVAGQKLVENKVDYGNEITQQVMPAVTKKVDSVTLENKEAAKETKAAAQMVAEESAKGQERIVTTVKALTETIKGDDGTCVTARIKRLEEQHEKLSQGQVETNNKIDKLTEAVKSIGVDVRKQSKF